jgi:hypothetical protein
MQRRSQSSHRQRFPYRVDPAAPIRLPAPGSPLVESPNLERPAAGVRTMLLTPVHLAWGDRLCDEADARGRWRRARRSRSTLLRLLLRPMRGRSPQHSDPVVRW